MEIDVKTNLYCKNIETIINNKFIIIVNLLLKELITATINKIKTTGT